MTPQQRASGMTSPGRSYAHGDNYGRYQGLPVRRMMRDGRPAGYEIQFNDEWMDMNQFRDPFFQEAFYEPWARQHGPQAAFSRWAAENPEEAARSGGGAGYRYQQPPQRRAGRTMRSRSRGGSRGGGLSEEEIMMLLGG